MQSEKIAELAKALIKVQKNLKGAKKDSENPYFKSKYADLESVWESCRELLSTNNLCVVQTMVASDKGILLKTTLLHESGEFISGEQPIMPIKPDPQSIGSASTYARRYGLAAIIGVVQTDDDAESAMQRNTNIQNKQNKPNPSAAKSSSPLIGGVGDFFMPFGREKGIALRDLSQESIEGALKWAVDKGKFQEFQEAALIYLKSLPTTQIPFDEQEMPPGF